MKIKLTDSEIVDLQTVRRKPGVRLNVAQDLITFHLVEADGLGYRITEAGGYILRNSTPVLQMGQNMKSVLGFRAQPRAKK